MKKTKVVEPADLVGRVITGVTAARMFPQRVEGGPDFDPFGGLIPSYVNSGLVYDLMHLWVQFDGLGWVCLKLTLEEIELLLDEPCASSEPFFLSSENVWVPASRVGPKHAPAALAAMVGATVTGITPLYHSLDPRPARWWRQPREYIEIGLIFETTQGSVAIADAGDEYAVGRWPDEQRWNGVEVVTQVDPRRVPAPTS